MHFIDNDLHATTEYCRQCSVRHKHPPPVTFEENWRLPSMLETLPTLTSHSHSHMRFTQINCAVIKGLVIRILRGWGGGGDFFSSFFYHGVDVWSFFFLLLLLQLHKS